MKKQITLVALAVVFCCACDPAYHLLIGNRSGQEKEIQVRALTHAVDFYESGEDIFDTGQLIRSDSLPATGKFVPLLLPDGQTIKILGSGIARPKGEAIIIGADTIDASTFRLKTSRLSSYKWGFVIEE
jgi:hypothetical protein